MEKQKTFGISRRLFLKISAGLPAVAGFSLPKFAHADNSHWQATLIDLTLCNGCMDREIPACVSACKNINKEKIPPPVSPIPEPWPRKIIEDWSTRQDVVDRLTPYNFIYVQKADIENGGNKKTVFVPRRCMHCDNPACATICPFSANHKHKNGAVVIDQETCFGGVKCKAVCPWQIPQRQSGVGIYLHILPNFMGNGVMYKCDLCVERLSALQKPACVDACPQKAMIHGARRDIYALAEERASKINGFIYGKKENGGTATLYVSDVPFELINKTMKKKPGRPDMPVDVKRRMAETDGLGKATLAAPVLGVMAAGVGLSFKWFYRRKDQIKGEGENE
ncbi:MAG: 4Fe-4S dicluster domain-containing protein [Smithella sp.]